jgi:ribose 5-phosphate isomerase B
MRVAIACDHAGFTSKADVIEAVEKEGHQVIDLGTNSGESVDYPDYAIKLGNVINNGDADRGIIICGSGVGACIAVNKIKGIYAAICHDTYSAHQGVEHDDMNVLCLGGRIVGPALINELVIAFLNARFVGNDPGQDRHGRRVSKVRKIETTDHLN